MLTLKALPTPLRGPISLAYLLARSADTLADSAEVPCPLRLQALEQFAQVLNTGEPAENARCRQALAALIRSAFLDRQTLPAEALLLQRFERCWQILQTCEDGTRRLIHEVLGHIIDGQRWDLEFFGAATEVKSLPDAQTLQRYTWQVAGCVGEFWTQLCLQLMPEVILPSDGRAKLLEQAAEYGCGLQRINILRDIAADLRLGRLYLPVSDAAAAAAQPVLMQAQWDEQWLKALQNLHQGRAYLRQLNHRGLRHATALPLLIGLQTLRALKQSNWEQRMQRVKISRWRVIGLLLRSLWASRSSTAMDQLVAELSHGLEG